MKAARLVILGVAIAAGGLAAMLASGPEGPPPGPAPEPIVKLETIEVLIAKAEIPMGHTVGAADMQWQTWPAAAAGPTFIRKNERPDAAEQLSGSLARSAFVMGEPIREAKLLKAQGSGFMAAILPSGMRAVSTDISPESSAAGFILPNDRVDVLLTRRDKAAEKAAGVEVVTSEAILQNIRVLAIDQAIQEKEGQKVVIGKIATLELTPRQAETLALSRQIGTLSLTLRSLQDANAPARTSVEEESGGRKGSVNMVRYGVTTTSTK